MLSTSTLGSWSLIRVAGLLFSSLVDSRQPATTHATRRLPEHESDAIQHDTTDESTSNRTQLSPRNAMELLVYYLMRQTHWTIVGHHDGVYVAGEGGDYMDEAASSPTGGIGAERS